MPVNEQHHLGYCPALVLLPPLALEEGVRGVWVGVGGVAKREGRWEGSVAAGRFS